ncbi:hypothetical protein POM88_018262 [Heracleum sosnowskyi]|uniref:Replication protein A subunit n=1 Tax=Heracleum sosnowskyi TaxID=360622 RepID=A0AAD8IQ71_9APIA|nr:hypothetical protein POM88_018262 [Heracleum sosnowskyi]
MSSRKYDDLLSLNQARSDWKIKVRVLRKWRGGTKTGELFKSFNIMLMDYKENKIQAFVPAKCVDDLENKLKVGSVCSITNFDVQPYKSQEKFRSAQNENHLILNINTKVRDVEEKGNTIPQESFDFYDHAELDGIKNVNVNLTDVIGIIQNREDISLKDLVNRLGNKNLQTKFTITDGSSCVNVTFWDALAQSFTQQLQLQPPQEPVIIIITCCKVGSWNDEVDLSNAAATTFYLNHQHHSVGQMRKMLANPKFYKNIQSSKTKKQSEVITHASIRYVDDKGNWYYHICTGCKEEIQSLGGDFICSKCNRRIPRPEKKFRISIIGSDESGCIEILLEDREVRTLLGKRAEAMYQEHFHTLEQQMGDQTFPKLLKNLEKTDITVKILVNCGEIRTEGNVYYANNICKGFYIPEVEEVDPSTSTQQNTTQVHILKDPFALINCGFEEPASRKLMAALKITGGSADDFINSDDELMQQIDEYQPDLAEYKRNRDDNIEKSLTNLNVNLATMTMQVTQLCKNHEEYCSTFKAQVPIMMEEIMRLTTQVDQLRKQINRPV